jgi:hypothetical protein
MDEDDGVGEISHSLASKDWEKLPFDSDISNGAIRSWISINRQLLIPYVDGISLN